MISVFGRVAGKLARYEIDCEDHVEAINMVLEETPKPTGPVLALIFERETVAEPVPELEPA
jgi:hypothetical protein